VSGADYLAHDGRVLADADVAKPVAALDAAAPHVSVVVAVFNGFELLRDAVESILAQEPLPNEILIVDDGSTDGDYTVFAEWSPLVRVIRQSNAGVSAARNRGIAEAKHDLIAFLDADDVWLPGKLRVQLEVLSAHPEAVVVFGGFPLWRADRAGHFVPWRAYPAVPAETRVSEARSGWLFARLMNGLLVGPSTAVARRAALLASGGFDERLRVGEDYDLWLRLSRTAPMLCVDAPVALYRMREGSAMHVSRRASENALARLLVSTRERGGLGAPHDSGMSESAFHQRMAAVHFDHGYNHIWSGDILVARREFAHARRYAPHSWRYRLYSLFAAHPTVLRFARRIGRRQ
jgi:glycosyltransferase involved in cell wall biosynthesis